MKLNCYSFLKCSITHFSKKPLITGNASKFFYSTKTYSTKSDLLPKLLENQGELGKVVILNGASSIGKTTFADYLAKFGFHKISYDNIYYQNMMQHMLSSSAANLVLKAKELLIQEEDIHRSYCGYRIKKEKYKSDQLNILSQLEESLPKIAAIPESLDDEKMFQAIYLQAKLFISSGRNVVVDMVLEKEQITVMREIFDYYENIELVLLYSSLEENLKRCFFRNILSIEKDVLNHRYINNVIDNYCDLYKFIKRNEISESTTVLDKVNKATTKQFLKEAIEHNNIMFRKLYSEFPQEKYEAYETKVMEAIKRANVIMNLETVEDIFVIPAVEFDYIMAANILGEDINGYCQVD